VKGKKNPKSSIPHSCVDFTIAAIGAGAAAPTVPANGNFRPTTSVYPLRANGISQLAAEIPTRTSAGIYVITYSADYSLFNVLFPNASVLSAGASPTSVLEATVTIVDPVARQITVKVYIPNGTLTDLGASDLLVIYLHGQDSTV
jgi:hypothetical protein